MITLKSNAVVNLINNLLDEAVCDGGDAGGAYHQNTDNLIVATSNLLNCLGLSEDYQIIETKDDCTSWSIVKIIEKKTAFKVES